MTNYVVTFDLKLGTVINTMTMGRVKVKEISGDEVHCTQIAGKGQLVLSQAAAKRRTLETAKGTKK